MNPISNDTILRDILAAIEAPTTNGRHIANLKDRAERAFGEINSWRTSPDYYFAPAELGRWHNSNDYSSVERHWRDHAVYYRAPRRDGKKGWKNIAIIGQPYGLGNGVQEELKNFVHRGFVLHVPPNPYASIWCPSWTLFLVLTLPGVAVRWLPEQERTVPELVAQTQKDWLEGLQELITLSPVIAVGELPHHFNPE